MTAASSLWARSEATLGRARAVERAAQALPPRLAGLLRALQALEDGRRDVVEATAADCRAAGCLEAAAVLELVLRDPEGCDPTVLRRDAKRRGEGAQVGFAWLDLYRMAAAWRAGAPTRMAAGLRDDARARTSVRGVVRLVGKADHAPPGGRHPWVSPRAQQVVWAADHLLAYGHVQTGCVRHAFGSSARLTFPEERWPMPSAIRAWATSGGPWTEAAEHEAEGYHHRPEKAPGGLLPVLARRVVREIGAGNAGGVMAALDCAVDLALTQSSPLFRQLAETWCRLSVVRGEVDEALELVWSERRQSLLPAERLHVARQLSSRAGAAAAGGWAEGGEAIAHAAVYAALASPEPDGALRCLRRVDVDAARRALPDARGLARPSPVRVQLVRAALRGLEASAPPPYAEARAMAEAGDRAEALALGAWLADALHGQAASPAELREWHRLVASLAGPGLSCEAWARLAVREAPLPGELVAAAEQACVEAEAGALGFALQLAVRLASPQAEAVQRRMGRLLRERAEGADDLALGWVIDVYSAPHAHPGFPRAVAPLVAFLAREGAHRLAALVSARHVAGSVDQAALIRWLLHDWSVPRTGEARWRLIRSALELDRMPGPLREAVERRVEGRRPRTLSDLLDIVHSFS